MGSLINQLVLNRINKIAEGTGKTMTIEDLKLCVEFCERRREIMTVETLFAVWITGGYKRSW